MPDRIKICPYATHVAPFDLTPKRLMLPLCDFRMQKTSIFRVASALTCFEIVWGENASDAPICRCWRPNESLKECCENRWPDARSLWVHISIKNQENLLNFAQNIKIHFHWVIAVIAVLEISSAPILVFISPYRYHLSQIKILISRQLPTQAYIVHMRCALAAVHWACVCCELNNY